MIHTDDFSGFGCPDCGTENNIYQDEIFGFYKCENCSAMWGFDEDDPDYEDDLLQELEAKQIAESLKESHLEGF